MQVSIVTSVVQVHLLLHQGAVGVRTVLMIVLTLICIGQVLVRSITGVAQEQTNLQTQCSEVLCGQSMCELV